MRVTTIDDHGRLQGLCTSARVHEFLETCSCRKSEFQSLVESIKDLMISNSLYFLIPWCVRGDIEFLALNRSVNLAIRLWLMINTQELKCKGFRHETDSVQWDDDRMVREFLQSPFPSAKWKVTAQSSRSGPHFTAAFMQDVCGLRIEWTASLHDHLRLEKKAKPLRVFPFKCHLQAFDRPPSQQ